MAITLSTRKRYVRHFLEHYVSIYMILSCSAKRLTLGDLQHVRKLEANNRPKQIGFLQRCLQRSGLHSSFDLMTMSSGLRSPPPPRSSAASPRPKFDSDLLKVYMKKLLSSTLQSSTWPEAKEREKLKGWMKEIGERVKERMLEIQPRGLYVSSFLHLFATLAEYSNFYLCDL